jgi:2-(1,2-epoxy-1,2-dihydrophenyl)acetyl-CoA isomerase
MALVETSGPDEGVQTIVLNQPDKLNALTGAMWRDLAQAVRSAERDDAVRALVLTGAGSGFCSGADVSEFSADGGAFDPGEGLRSSINPLMTRLHTMEKPVLAAINGVAAGAGLSLALACDMRIAAESARMVIAFVRIGLVPDGGLFYFLPRLIGPAKTLELAWTGEPISASDAFDLGMLNRVVPDTEVLAKTQELAARLSSGPLKTLALIKRAVNQAHELPLERVLELEAAYQTIAAREPNFAEGLAAFREKRAPRFNNRS